ncbi:MAG: threonine-phosphate decarboxylase CobD [Rhodocyclaceae bacterium]|nr:threonine-phosphate decarboxylase CobD [Rhodocyclaceae bacterium]
MLEHGGRLGEAARRYGIPREQWLDLSTGIAPWTYPLPTPPVEVWQRLPEEDDGLEEAAHAYYGFPALPVPGSQWALETIPRLLPPGRVAMPWPFYAEHPHAWQAAGHRIVDWRQEADYAVCCQPNNPTGLSFSRAELLAKAERVRLLVVDEAFLDATPEATMIGVADHVLVLRSLGKFFGLAGVRIGFVIAPTPWRERLRAQLSPWAVSSPARWAARQALADHGWHMVQRERLHAASSRLAQLLSCLGPTSGCAFFHYLPTHRAEAIHAVLARSAILVRRLHEPPALRFGLPADEPQWQRLQTALGTLT